MSQGAYAGSPVCEMSETHVGLKYKAEREAEYKLGDCGFSDCGGATRPVNHKDCPHCHRARQLRVKTARIQGSEACAQELPREEP